MLFILVGLMGGEEARAQSSLDDFLNNVAVIQPQPANRKSSDISRVREQYGQSFRDCEAGMHVASRVVVHFDVIIDKRGRITKLDRRGASGLPAEVTECLDEASRVVRGRVRMPLAHKDKEISLPLDLRGPIWTSSLSLPVEIAPIGGAEALAAAVSTAVAGRTEALGRCVAQAVWGEETRGRPAPTYALSDLITDGVEVELLAAQDELTAAAVKPPTEDPGNGQRAALFSRLWTGEASEGAGRCYAEALGGLALSTATAGHVLVKIDLAAAADVYPKVDARIVP